MTRSLLIGTLALLTPGALLAQIVRGQVVDSLTQSPLSGGTVILLNETDTELARTVSDPGGLFLLRGPSAGTFYLRVEGDGLRPSVFPPFDLSVDQMKSFMLLIASDRPPVDPAAPDLATLAGRACGEGTVGVRQPAILGTVRDAVDGQPIAGANVMLSWSTVPDAVLEHVGFQGAGGAAVTGSTGMYAVCAAPVGTPVTMYAEWQGRMSRLVEVQFGDSGVTVEGRRQPSADFVWQHEMEILAESQMNASISGTVLDSTGARVGSARVAVVGTSITTRANFLGDFEINRLPPGSIRLSVEQVGYRPKMIDVDLDPGQRVELPATELQLMQAPVALAPLEVEAEAPRTRRNLAEFERRRETSNGSFLTREEWERMGAVDETVDILRRLRGVRIRPGSSLNQPWIITSTRGPRGGLTGGVVGGQCYPIIFLDRMFIGNTGNVILDRAIPVTNLEAVEFYEGTAGLPAEFNRAGSVCGVLVFWTR